MDATAVAPTPSSGTVGRSVWLAWREARPVVQCMFQLRFLVAAAFSACALLVAGSLLLGDQVQPWRRITASWSFSPWFTPL